VPLESLLIKEQGMFRKVIYPITIALILVALFTACNMGEELPGYTIIYHSNFGGDYEEAEPVSVDITYGVLALLRGSPNDKSNFVHPDGLYFIGWALSKDGPVEYYGGQNESFQIDEEFIPLYARWGYRVTFPPDGGTPEPSPKYLLPGDPIAKPDDMEKLNHTFLGWYIQGTENTWDFVNRAISEDDVNSTHTLNLAAKWDLTDEMKCYVYFVTYAGDLSPTIPTQTITKGGNAEEPPNPGRTGYAFLHWSKADVTNEFVFATEPVIATMTLYAQWTPISYSVRFNSNYPALSTPQSGSMSDQTFAYDEEKPLTANAFTCTGYVFDGWNRPSNGESYANSAPVKNLSSDHNDIVILDAKWKKQQCTVTFDSNGGTTVAGATVDHGGTVSKPSDPTRTYTAVEGLYEGTWPARWT